MTPTALYLPVEGIDVAAGERILRDAGYAVQHVPREALIPADGSAPCRFALELLPDLPREDVAALLIGYDAVGGELMAQLPHLRIIATHSDGYDMVDLDAARDRGITVCNLPDSASEEVAVHALMLTLSLLRRVGTWQHRVRAGRWVEDESVVLRRPSTLTCGVIGLGRIGGRYARLVTSVFGRTLGCDPYLPADRWPSGVEPADADTIFRDCDVVSLHVPLTDETRMLASARRIGSMRRGAVFVNVSRGELVDEPALLAALESGQLGGVGLDVLRDEPPEPGNRLLRHERAIVTPHIAYLSRESLEQYAAKPAAGVAAYLSTGRPATRDVTRPV